jgi:carbamoylphosphate synthase large subunit
MQQGDFVPDNLEALGPKILLTDTNRWAGPARIAIGLTKAGCRVSAVCPPRGHPLMATRVVQETFRYSSIHPLESLVAAIEATKPQIIIPCDDRGVQHLHELYVRARSQGTAGNGLVNLLEYSLGSPESYTIVSARCDLLNIAHEEGIRIPDTKPLKTVDDLKSWQAGHPFPWVLKGDGTFGGRGVRIAHTREEAEKYYSKITKMFGAVRAFKRAIVNRDPFWLRPWWHNHKPAIIVQSHIKGRPANCGVVCWEGKVLAGISVEVVSSEGLTGPANIVRVVDNPEMMLAADRIARRLGLSGFFGLDFIIEEGSGAGYLIEMNPRCTPLSHLQLGKERDMIEALGAQLSGRPLQETPPVTQNEIIAYFPQAWQSKSEYIATSFQDIPQGEPDLVQDLLRPWPDRSLLYRFVSKVSGVVSALKDRKASSQGVPNA